MSVVIETTKGKVTVDLYTEQRPKVCKNFLKLCKVKYYNTCLFHSVQPRFVAQTGDATGTGTGGESVYRRLYGDQATFFEGDALPRMGHRKSGTLSMVNSNAAGPSSSDGKAAAAAAGTFYGSQFFITLADEGLDYLDNVHCVFGEVVEDPDNLLDRLNETICDEQHRPYQEIRITHTVILDDPFEDPPGLEVPEGSPGRQEALRAAGGALRIAADEDVYGSGEESQDALMETMAEKEAKAQATILEMVGDLPDADCAPPENVLFVCKLNPVTTDDDLEIIFSRFGKVVSCEVIRDKKTGDSLQYAFIEFQDQKACEVAYSKMDNVLIDDRRIHVDFSQSVAKFRWKGKGRLEVFGDGGPSRGPHRQGPNFSSEQPRQSSYDRGSFSSRSAGRGHQDRRDGARHAGAPRFHRRSSGANGPSRRSRSPWDSSRSHRNPTSGRDRGHSFIAREHGSSRIKTTDSYRDKRDHGRHPSDDPRSRSQEGSHKRGRSRDRSRHRRSPSDSSSSTSSSKSSSSSSPVRKSRKEAKKKKSSKVKKHRKDKKRSHR